MTDPVTLGVVVATALSLGAEAAKTVVGDMTKDVYEALKRKVSAFAPHDVAELEKSPQSKGRQGLIAEIVDGLSDDDRKEVRALAEALSDKLEEKGGPSIGLDIGRLRAARVELGEIDAKDGIGIRIGDADVTGTFGTGRISVGPDRGK